MTGAHVRRWTGASVGAVAGLVLVLGALGAGPLVFSNGVTDRLTALFVYILLAMTWNALAGYGGLVSIGQQAFFGLGAYLAIRLSHAGIDVYLSLALAALLVGLAAVPVSAVALRLRAGEFAISMWVIAELMHLVVNLDGLVQGETGTSLIALNAYDALTRRNLTYWSALASVAIFGLALLMLLRSRYGLAIQAIRDDEAAAQTIGVRITRTKRVIFVLAALGAGLAGALWLATTISFQPKTYFSVQWTAYMIFMVLVGGLGTFEGPVLGAILFFAIETVFGGSGVLYLVGLGLAALVFAVYLPKGLWGWVERHVGLRLLPVGYRLVLADGDRLRSRSAGATSSVVPQDGRRGDGTVRSPRHVDR